MADLLSTVGCPDPPPCASRDMLARDAPYSEHPRPRKETGGMLVRDWDDDVL
jgi:hypothetical protein